MNNTPNRAVPGLSRKQLAVMAAILIGGIAVGGWILGSSPAGAPDDHASHSEARGHDDSEHHGAKAADRHDHATGHGDPEHHASPSVAEADSNRLVLSDSRIRAAGVGIDKAGPATIRTSSILPGEIRFNEDRTAHVVPRLAGVVESVPANLGQPVRRGQVLAVIASTGLSELRSELLAAQKRLSLAQSTYAREKQLWQERISAEQDYLAAQQTLREAEISVANVQQKLLALGAPAGGAGSLNRYEIRAPFDGIVVEKHIALGEAVKEDASIFTLSDLSSVWAEMVVPAKDLNVVRVGENAVVRATAFDSTAEGRIAYVGALLGQDTRSAKARVTLANPKMAWRPGLFVNVEVVSGEARVPVSIAADAVQTLGDRPVVFVRVADGFVARPVTLGRSDGRRIEVSSGLEAGTPYAASGSFVLKSELGKGSAEHGH